MKIVFFHTPKPKKFEYKPLYYDTEKEEREQRRKELGLEGESSDHKSFFRGELQKKWRSGGKVNNKKSRLRSMIYLGILLMAIYYIFFTNFVQKLVSLITMN
ncbi:MAG: hypothetical protein GY834_12215 [Bacteroidetes bacterium]|nr:hypothetical protein [Bacteroidota bacterium]